MAMLVLNVQPAEARLTRITIESTKPAPASPVAIPYEILTGQFAGELDPRDSHNRIITDLQFAPRNARGRVEYTASFALARPLDTARASGVLFYEVSNRGNGVVLPDEDGHLRVISGWQGDIAPSRQVQWAKVPVAVGKGGHAITGPVLTRMVNIAAGAGSVAITGGIGRPTPRPLPVSLDTRKAHLYRQQKEGDVPVAIAAHDWALADCSKLPFPGKPDPRQLCVRDGFDPAAAYTVVYEGKDPLVLGMGFAATRDLIAFLRSGKPDDSGTANPAGTSVHWAVASGTSQSGNFLRSFVHLGFNADESNGRVFDGINDDIAARQVPLNVRFGVPGGAANAFEPGSEGTLWWGRYEDRIRGRGASSLLDRCTASHSCPKVIETIGSSEFWGLRASPGFVGTEANADLPLPANVRRYYFPSVTHGGARVGTLPGSGGNRFRVAGDPIPPGCALPGNPNPSWTSLRVTRKALVAWVKEGVEPPASRYPSLANGDLVEPTVAAMGWPVIPGAPSPEGKLNQLLDYDFGPAFVYRDLSGVTVRQPPKLRRILPSRVPRVNSDGNETAGVLSVELQVPIGTYLGWNVQGKGFGAGGGCGFAGGFIPFARTRAERTEKGDPRLSLEERYADHAGFVARIRAAVAAQQAAGWLLADDAERIVLEAEASEVLGPGGSVDQRK
jgi:hypothetical protein